MVSTPLTTDEARLIRLFKALSNPVRYRMVRFMVAQPQCITGDIVNEASLAQSTVSQHLKVLRDAGLVRGEIDGPAMSYCLDLDTLNWFAEQVNAVTEEFRRLCC